MTPDNPPIVSTKHFTYDKPSNLLVAEASDLPNFGRIWFDALDIGLVVVSDKTGRAVTYVVDDVKNTTDEILWWDLVSTEPDLPLMRIFND